MMYNPENAYYSMGARQCKNAMKREDASQLLHSVVQKLENKDFWK